jgi:hypothetical protein
MTQSTAEKIANAAMAAAVAGVAYYVVTTPSLRRLAWRLALTGLTGMLPGWFRQEIRHGWQESGRIPATRRSSGAATRIESAGVPTARFAT